MKKICSVLLILTLILSLTACKTPAAEVESGALAETPVEEQEPTKEEQAPESKEETQEPSQEVPEETDDTQPQQQADRITCDVFLYFKEEYKGTQYSEDDFKRYGVTEWKEKTNGYDLKAEFDHKQELIDLYKGIQAMSEVDHFSLYYYSYSDDATQGNGAYNTVYPWHKGPERDTIQLNDGTKVMDQTVVGYLTIKEDSRFPIVCSDIEDSGLALECLRGCMDDSGNTSIYFYLANKGKAEIENGIQRIETLQIFEEVGYEEQSDEVGA